MSIHPGTPSNLFKATIIQKRSRHGGRAWGLALILLLTTFLYLPTLAQSFVSWDDQGHLTENLQVRNLKPDNIGAIFQSDVNQTYIPLTIFTFAIEYHFFSYNSFVYHLDNLLLHLGVVAFLYFLTLCLGFSASVALLASLLFAIHPMHVESVAWVTQRKDVLYSFFYMLALWQYTFYIQEKKVSVYFLTLLFAVLSILAKPMALSLPLVLFLLDWFLGRRFNWRLIIEKVPFFLVVFGIAWLTYAMNMRAIDLQFPSAILTWVWCFVFYLAKFVFPSELLVLYQVPRSVSLLNAEFLFAAILFLVLVLGLIRFKQNRIFLFAVGYFFLSIFFLLRFDDQKDLTIVADRFMYLPSAGICIFLGWGAMRLLELAGKNDKRIRLFILTGLVAIIFVLAFMTSSRVRLWGNEYLLWDQVAKRYQNAVAYSQLGNYFLKKDDFKKALENYQRAIAISPSYSKPYSNIGMVMVKLGNYEQAVEFFSQTIKLEPKESGITFTNRGYAYVSLGRNADALADYNHAIAVDKRYLPAYLNRATLYKNQKDFTRAMADLDSVLRIDPGNKAAQNNRQILRKMILDENSH